MVFMLLISFLVGLIAFRIALLAGYV
jgi:hypothetical protein